MNCRRFGALAPLLFLTAVGLGCRSAQIYLDGDVRPGFEHCRYARIAVYGDIEDASVRAAAERHVAEVLTDDDLLATPMSELLTVDREYSEAEAMDVIGRQGYDAVVRIRVKDYEVAEYATPGGVAVYYDHFGAHTVFQPGYRWCESHLDVQLELVDRGAREAAWSGQAVAEARGDRDLNDLLGSVSRRLRKELRRREVLE